MPMNRTCRPAALGCDPLLRRVRRVDAATGLTAAKLSAHPWSCSAARSRWATWRRGAGAAAEHDAHCPRARGDGLIVRVDDWIAQYPHPGHGQRQAAAATRPTTPGSRSWRSGSAG